jgi:hypothetical protein
MNMKSYTRPVGRAISHYADRLPDMSDLTSRLPDMPEIRDETAAKALGWVSIAIGLSEILMPRRIEKTMGIGNGQNTGTLRVLGVREICQGIDILTHEDPTPGLMARVAGDLLDGVCLARAATQTRKPDGFMAVCAMVLPVVVLDMIYAKRCMNERCES